MSFICKVLPLSPPQTRQEADGWEFPGGLAVTDLLWSLLGRELDPWPRNFLLPWARPQEKKKKKRLVADNLKPTLLPLPRRHLWAIHGTDWTPRLLGSLASLPSNTTGSICTLKEGRDEGSST